MSADERPIVAFLGPEASYTHQAALDTFNKDKVTLCPQITIADVFTAVQDGSAYRGVVPFENSSNGSVVFTLDLIGDVQSKHPDIIVCDEAYVVVKHCLLGHASPSPAPSRNVPSEAQGDATWHKPRATPKSDLSMIKKLYSHPQAWGQCKDFLATHLKGVERQDVSSTSRAAEIVAHDKTAQSAALSSQVAAKLFGLDVLAENINDSVANTTRFLVLRHRRNPMSAASLSCPLSPNGDNAEYKTLVTFTVDHANPGALARCLAVFETYGLNLTSINTRPSGVENWHYIFFVELQGRREEGGPVEKALMELDHVARGWRWLGSWKNRL